MNTEFVGLFDAKIQRGALVVPTFWRRGLMKRLYWRTYTYSWQNQSFVVLQASYDMPDARFHKGKRVSFGGRWKLPPAMLCRMSDECEVSMVGHVQCFEIWKSVDYVSVQTEPLPALS